MSDLYHLSSQSELKVLRLRPALQKYFGEMSDETFEEFASLLEWVELPANRLLVRQGDRGDSMYILISGRLQAWISQDDGSKQIIGEVAKGESVGEMALFTGDPRSADILSIRDSLLVKISKETFDKLVQKFPQSAINISKLIINRFNKRVLANNLKPPVVNVTILPLNPQVPTKEFSERLVKSLSKFGKVLYLSRENISDLSSIPYAAKVTEGDASHAKLTNWLDEQEFLYKFVIYEVGSEFDAWTRRCLRQADRLLLLANFEDAANPGQVENNWLKKEVPDSSSRQELVLIHKYSDELPRLTRRWLRPRKLDRHYHIRWSRPGDFDRLARFMSGNTIGMVLGGGGAKGFAHLGVYRALQEAGTEIDFFAGTSIGAVFGAEMAMGRDYDTMFAKGRRNFARKNPVGDYNFYPIVALSRGKRINQMLKGLFDGHDIEDLWTNFFCVSANMHTAEVKILKDGELWEAVRCSLAIPGVLPPMIRNRALYIDGGALNNLPVDLLRKEGIGKIIAVDLELSQNLEIPYEAFPSSLQILRTRLFSKGSIEFPRLISTIWKSIILGSSSKKRENIGLSDMYLNPPMGAIGLMNWKAYKRAVNIGYEYTQKRLQEGTPDWLVEKTLA
ncbi:MAG: patatin-like phospholipase family protein [Bacteroidia bacterium]|nr:patatin-like phospholipase family protein [Bacteroidia bacterium]